jgi:hypothetical protein
MAGLYPPAGGRGKLRSNAQTGSLRLRQTGLTTRNEFGTGARPDHSISLLDHLVGDGEQVRWDFETERSCGLHIDDELELARLHHGKIGLLLAL